MQVTTHTYHVYRYNNYFSTKYACFREGITYDADYLLYLFRKNRSWRRVTTIRLTSTQPIWDTQQEVELLTDLLQVKKLWLAT